MAGGHGRNEQPFPSKMGALSLQKVYFSCEEKFALSIEEHLRNVMNIDEFPELCASFCTVDIRETTRRSESPTSYSLDPWWCLDTLPSLLLS